MRTLTTTTSCCPNSFQLRRAFSSRKLTPFLVRMRVHKVTGRQVRAFSAAGESARNGNGAEQRDSWANYNSTVDGFSGWFGENGSGDSQGKRGIAGIMGAGVAGLILVAGLTFASLSISKSMSKPKEQMEPLTAQQVESLTIEIQNGGVEKEGNESTDPVQGNGSKESKTGIEKDSSLYIESNEASSGNMPNDSTHLGNKLNGDVANNNAFIKKDLQSESASDGVPGNTEDMPKLPESESGRDSFALSSFNESESSHSVEIIVLNTKQNENLKDAEIACSLGPDANPTRLNAESQEEVLTLTSANSNLLLDSSSSTTTLPQTESLVFNVSNESQLDGVLKSENEHKEDVDNTNSHSSNEALDLRKIEEVSAEVNKPSLELHGLNGGGSLGTASVSMANQFASEHDGNVVKDMNGSRAIFDSTNPNNFFSSAGIPAPSVLSAGQQALPGKILVPAVVDQVQGQALAALQVLKVIEVDVQPGDLCTRREYARWLVSASSALSRNSIFKVYPAMYIENVTELAFDDITPEDADFPSIQGLAEAGLISSKLSKRDMSSSFGVEQSTLHFSPESPLSRQDLVSWKMAVEKTQLPVADRKTLQQLSGFIDIDKINPDAWPALVADLSTGEQGIVALAFGYTRLFQPDKPVTKAQAAIALATGEASDLVSEELARIEAESMAEKAVAAHSALVAQVEKDINASFEKEFSLEREKIDAVEKLAQEAGQELERLRAEREEEKIALMKERAAVDSEMEVLSRLRREVEDQLQNLMGNKAEILYEKERLSKLRNDAEIENQEIARLQYELEVERKALSMARTWAEDEAKRAREQAKALEEARFRWEKHGIKVVVDDDLREEADAGVTWLSAGKDFSVEGTVSRAENLVDKLKTMVADVRVKSRDTIHKVIEKILFLISTLKEWALKVASRGEELKDAAMTKASSSLQQMQHTSAEVTLVVKEGVKRVAGDCREGVEKLTQRFKT